MSTSTEVALFAGSTPEAVLAHAADAAQQLNDVVRKQRMFTRIGSNDHIHVEAWQTLGAMTGVVVSDGVVEPLPWPPVEALGERPPDPDGPEPRDHRSSEWRRWKAQAAAVAEHELHAALLRARALGRTYGYRAECRATKSGEVVGWGVGIVARDEPNHVGDEDHALSGMAQTRAQSRALAAPLRFIVKLAGYEGTPIEDLDGTAPQDGAERIAELEAELAALREATTQLVYADDQSIRTAAEAVNALLPDLDGLEVVGAIGRAYAELDGVPEVACRALRILKWASDQLAAGNARFQAPVSAGPEQPPDAEVVP